MRASYIYPRLILLAALPSFNAYTSSCQIEISGAGFSRTVAAEPALFGPHLPFARATPPSNLGVLPEACLRGCVTAPSSPHSTSCSSILDGVRGKWAIVERPLAPITCDGASPPLGPLSPAGMVRACEGAGAVGVVVVEADDSSPQRGEVTLDGDGLTIPALWTDRRVWRGNLQLRGGEEGGWRVTPSCVAPELPADGGGVAYSAGRGRSLYFIYRSTATNKQPLAFVASPGFGMPRLFVSHSISRWYGEGFKRVDGTERKDEGFEGCGRKVRE